MTSARGRRTRRPQLATPRRDYGAWIALGALAAAILGASLLVDPRAAAAFDAPKRLAALGGIALAVAALAVLPRPGVPGSTTPARRRLEPLLFGVALGGGLVAALVSPRAVVSLDAMRVVLLFALLVPLGASRALDGGRARLLLLTFLAAGAVNAAVSVLQHWDLVRLFAVATPGGRVGTGALAGNEGDVAVVLTLATLAALAVLLLAEQPLSRAAAIGGIAVFLPGLAVNRNLTAVFALLAGTSVLLVVRFRRRAALPATLAALLVAGAVAVQPDLRARALEALGEARFGDWDRTLTYRLGPWAAALEMARARPFTGWGPGTFGAEFVPHRLRAEIRYRTRFVNPFLAGAYVEAHSEYLQAIAEVGIPVSLVAVAATGSLLVGVGRMAWRAEDTRAGEAALLLTLLIAGAATALTWFPLQRPILAVPLLLAAGRAWRIGWSRQCEGHRPMTRWGVALVLLVLVGGLAPELPRYRAERQLRETSARFLRVLLEPRAVGDPVRALEQVAQAAVEAAPALPGDWRPLSQAGAARLVARQGAVALDLYRSALALGERPEIVVNLGRAYALLGRAEDARAAFLRAGWVSPAILATLPDQVRAPLWSELEAQERALRAGRLAAPPALVLDRGPAPPPLPG